MPFGAIAENLVNTLDESIAVPEHLATPADVATSFSPSTTSTWPRRATAADLEAVREVRTRVRGLFTADELRRKRATAQ